MASEVPTAPVSDRETIAQATLAAEELQPYFHGRAPIRVVVNRQVNPAWSLTLNGAAVEWVDETSLEPRIEFTLLRVEGNNAAAIIRYEVEGVVMHTEFKRQGEGGEWAMFNSELVEE